MTVLIALREEEKNMSEKKTLKNKYRITIDFDNNEICFTTEIREALGCPEGFNFVFRKRDAILGITEKIICEDPKEKIRTESFENAWSDCWNETTKLFHVKTETFLRVIKGYIPGRNQNGVYTFSGKKAEGANVVLFDLKKYIMKREQNI